MPDVMIENDEFKGWLVREAQGQGLNLRLSDDGGSYELVGMDTNAPPASMPSLDDVATQLAVGGVRLRCPQDHRMGQLLKYKDIKIQIQPVHQMPQNLLLDYGPSLFCAECGKRYTGDITNLKALTDQIGEGDWPDYTLT